MRQSRILSTRYPSNKNNGSRRCYHHQTLHPMLWRHTLTMSTAGNDPVSSLRVNEFICKSSDTVALILRFGRAHQRSSLSLRSSQANIPRVISWSTIYSDVSRLTMGHLTQRISNYRNVKGNWGTNGVFPSLDNHCLNFVFFF